MTGICQDDKCYRNLMEAWRSVPYSKGNEWSHRIMSGDQHVASVVMLPCEEPGDDYSAEKAMLQERANARLIAAAPELLEALKEAQCWLPHGDNKRPADRGAKCSTAYEMFAQIEAAIAKAEGRG